MERKLLPWSYLVLFAKHWITFPELDKDNNPEECFWKELKYVLYMCGYMPVTKSDCVYLVSKAVDMLKKFYADDDKSGLGHGLNTLFEIVHGIEEWKGYFYNENIDYKTALIYHILSALSMLNIKDYAIGYVDYVKYECKIAGECKNLSFEECQEIFNNMFKERITDESYKEAENIVNGFKEYVR